MALQFVVSEVPTINTNAAAGVVSTSTIAAGDFNVYMPGQEPTEAPAMSDAAWSGPIAFEGQLTGDGRLFAPGAINWLADSLPMPFRWVRSDSGGHNSAVTIGRVDNLIRNADGAIMANGVVFCGPDAPPEAAEYLNLLANGAAGGVSVDGDNAEYTVVEQPNPDGAMSLQQHFSSMRLRALTAVDIPAFIGARIALQTPGATPTPDMPPPGAPMPMMPMEMPMSSEANCSCGEHIIVAASTAPWNGAAGQYSDAQYKTATAACDSGPGTVKQNCFLPHHEPGGALNINGLHAAAQRASMLKNRSPAAVASAKAHLRAHYKDVGEDPPPSIQAAVEAIVASAIPLEPPAEWFEDPALDGPTPITVTADGHVYGHLALFSTCHIAQPACVTPPRGSTYAYFHTGELIASGGQPIAVGHMTFGTGHAALGDNALAAASHYDNTGTVGADVRAGEDAHGIWLSGALRPTLTDEDIRVFRSAPPSGDWRRIGGRLELVAALAVNTPGFPVPRTRARVLVASGLEHAVIAAPLAGDFEPNEVQRQAAKVRIFNRIVKQELGLRVAGKKA